MRLSEARGEDWSALAAGLCGPLSRWAGWQGMDSWLRQLSLHPDTADVTLPLRLLPGVGAQLQQLLQAEDQPPEMWLDEDVLWLLLTLRRHPAHRVIGVMMSLRNAACRRLTEAALEEYEEQRQRQNIRDALLRQLMTGVSDLLGMEELPVPGMPWLDHSREAEDTLQELLERLGEEEHGSAESAAAQDGL